MNGNRTPVRPVAEPEQSEASANHQAGRELTAGPGGQDWPAETVAPTALPAGNPYTNKGLQTRHSVLITSGLDTLRYLVLGKWDEDENQERAVIREARERVSGIEKGRQRLKLSSGDVIDVWGYTPRPYGSFRFEASFDWKGNRVHLVERGHKALAMVQLDALPLQTQTPHLLHSQILHLITTLNGRIERSEWTRADHKTDATVPPSELLIPTANEFYVGGGKRGPDIVGGIAEPETVYVGRPQPTKRAPPIFCRMYNKTRQLESLTNRVEALAKKEAIHGALQVPEGDDPDILRVEFQMHGAGMRKRFPELATVEGLLDRLPELVAYAYGDYLRVTETKPDKARRNQSRAITNPLWEALGETAVEQAGERGEDLRKATREPTAMSEAQHGKRVYRNAILAAAIDDRGIETERELILFTAELMYRYLQPGWREEIQERREYLEANGLADPDAYAGPREPIPCVAEILASGSWQEQVPF